MTSGERLTMVTLYLVDKMTLCHRQQEGGSHSGEDFKFKTSFLTFSRRIALLFKVLPCAVESVSRECRDDERKQGSPASQSC